MPRYNAERYAGAKDAVLKWICEQSAAICNHPDVFSCTWVARGVNITLYMARKCMRDLAEDGYVKKSHEGGWSDWTGEIYCIHGYTLTQKGVEHPYYQRRLNEDMDWWNRAIKGEFDDEQEMRLLC